MKFKARYLVLGVIPLLSSCASAPPVTLAPVGPAPVAGERYLPASGDGRLEVYTETEEYEYDRDVSFYPHRDYQIYTAGGEHLKRVWNHQNHEDELPATVSLPAGHYVVKAEAERYGLVSVPVVIKPFQTTRVILQPGWDPGKSVPRADLVRMPGGYAVGWKAELAGQP